MKIFSHSPVKLKGWKIIPLRNTVEGVSVEYMSIRCNIGTISSLAKTSSKRISSQYLGNFIFKSMLLNHNNWVPVVFFRLVQIPRQKPKCLTQSEYKKECEWKSNCWQGIISLNVWIRRIGPAEPSWVFEDLERRLT